MKSPVIRGVVVVCLLVWTLQASAALKILITNDDGFETENIQALYYALVDAGHDVIMSAPYSGQSGTSGKIDFLQPILPTAEDSPQGTLLAGSPGVGETGLGLNQFYVDGTPAAAVLYGIDVAAVRVWGTFPDLVISGPNEGNNLGIVTPHSGTIGAAVTALNKGIPAIALSAESGDADAAEIVAKLAVKLVDTLDGRRGVKLPEGIGLNVNTPVIDGATAVADDFRFKLTKIGESANFGLRFYESLDESQIASAFDAGVPYPGVSLEIPATLAGYPEDNSRNSETNALEQGFVTVSPIQGTYAASNPQVRNLRGKLQPLFRKH